MTTITVSIFDDRGDEFEVELPARFEVCPQCEGHGTHLNPAIGEHAYTSEEFFEAFEDEESRTEYFRRGGRYDVQCTLCSGKRVVTVVNEEMCQTSTQKAALEAYNRQLDEDADYRRMCEDERRAGC